MALSSNATPFKMYLILFVILFVGYIAFIVIKSLKMSNSIEVEHFVEESPNYKYRLEVMKVFDLYLNRNPTPEEINKYAAIGNEQDILLEILKDFDIKSGKIEEEYADYKRSHVEIEEEYIDYKKERVVKEEYDTSIIPPEIDIPKFVNDNMNEISKSLDKSSNLPSDSRLQDKMNDIKKKVNELHALVNN